MTPPNRPLPAVVSDAHRDAVAQALSAHFANDRITVETLDARMAMVYEATTMVELERALADIEISPRPDTDPGHPAIVVGEELVPQRSVAMAVLGGFETKGSWVLPRQLKVVAILGGGVIDLREARFGAGISEMDISCALGGVEVVVPPGVRLEVLGSGILGGFAVSSSDTTAFDPQAPVLRIRGIALLGGVDIKVRGPSKKMLKRFEEAMARVHLGRGRNPTPRP